MSIEQLKKDWEKFEQVQFPNTLRGKQVANFNLVMVHSDAASAIITTFQTNGQVSTRIRSQLTGALDKLQLITAELTGSDQKYFQDLIVLAKQAQSLFSV